MIEIKSQKAVDELIKSIDWSEAAVQEMHVISPSHLIRSTDGKVLDTPGHGGGFLRLLITIPFEPIFAIELVFWQVSCYCMTGIELTPNAEVTKNGVIFILVPGEGGAYICARRLWYRLLDDSVWGPRSFYCESYPLDEDGIPLDLNL